MNENHTPQAKVVVERYDGQVATASVAVNFSQCDGGVVLESSLRSTTYGRYSIFASHPVEIFTADAGRYDDPFSALGSRVADWPGIPISAENLPFVGGWIGFFSYEAGLTLESIRQTTAEDCSLPLMQFSLYDSAAIYDHDQEQWYMTAVDWPEPVAKRRPSVRDRLDILKQRLENAGAIDIMEDSQPDATVPKPNMSFAQYVQHVEKAKRYIEAGDIYQVNLTQRFCVETSESPIHLYENLRRVNPSSHAAYLQCDETTILSASPELFLELRNKKVITRPIKGTAPRTDHVHEDNLARQNLIDSEKDRAELTMIVDLMRNDLGRVCQYGSVHVVEPNEIEEHPTVFHQVATIEGQLREDVDWLGLLHATFPGGSITGAPKIRAMQIIDELEPTARGVYCGSIGWIGLDGSMSFNIAIRTMVHCDHEVYFYAGGAIVADSTAENEYDEIIAKASGMMRALGCDAPLKEMVKMEAAVR